MRRSDIVKPTADDHDPVFDRLVARGLEKESDASGTACPDADLLAAWYDRSLAPAEASRIEEHAASCAVCQQILADLSRSEPEVIRAAPAPRPARPLFWHWRWVVPAATAAIVIIVVGARTLIAPTFPAGWPPSVAKLEAPAPPPPGAGAAPSGATTLGAGTGGASTASATPPGGLPAAPSAKLENRVADRRAEKVTVDANAPARSGAVAAPSANDLVAPAQKAGADAKPAEALADASARQRTQPQGIGAAESLYVAQPAKTAERADAAAAPPAAARAAVAPRSAFLSVSPAQQVTASVEPTGGSVLWRYGDRGTIERSADRGQTWEPQQSGVNVRLADASSPSWRVCWVVGAAGTIVRTIDGRTWERVKSPTAGDLVSVHAWSENSATITAASREVYTTADGGATWRRQ
jgi:hypothetical protein